MEKRNKIIILISLIYISSCSFQLNLFKEFIKEKENENICISPISIYQVLSLATNGAKGKTQTEMVSILTDDEKSNSVVELNKNNVIYLDILKESKGIEIANSILSKIKIEESFLLASKKYNAYCDKLTSAKQVNNWCNEKTHGKIKKIIDNLNDDIMVILLNAVYFKLNWAKQFKKDMTKKMKFYLSNNKSINVDMMHQSISNCDYYQDDYAQIVELPYQGWNFTAMIILPDKSVNINDYIKNYLDDKKLNEYNYKLSSSYDVDLYLPKFEINYGKSLVDILKKLGMNECFDDNADFSNLSKIMKLKISDVIHKTYIKVDESGTEAAAVTSIMFTKNAIFSKPNLKISMKVDRPFLFLIQHREIKNLTVFIAKIENII